ncbi:ArgS-related anticodon-binding protein NrtL [Streptomyces sp. NPDC029003]|uniref:ArgS-related anticodon-binding protein NrtL n=1 Tax=Streptomyces sp. NPDC029003 TaxID=3155125 RepID=UPI0033E1EDDD
MIPADLSRAVVRAVRRAVEGGELGGTVPERVVVERTRPGGAGEYASPVAFQLAKGADRARRAPLDVANTLAALLRAEPGIARVDVTGAGFLNFTLAPRSDAALVREVLRRGPRYGYAEGAFEAGPFRWAEAVGPRERAVREAVARIRAAQGCRGEGEGLAVAPVARRDGDAVARFGADAARWAMLAVPPRETPSFPSGLLAQDESNDPFLVRYAHSRARALVRGAAGLGFPAEAADTAEAAGTPEAADCRALAGLLADHPLVLEAAAHHRAPERLCRHLVTVADVLLDHQHHVLPRGDEKPSAAHRARLALAEAAGTVLAGGLALLGMDAPDFL